MSGREFWRRCLMAIPLLLGCGGEGGSSPSPSPTGSFAGTIFFVKFSHAMSVEGIGVVIDSADLLVSTDDRPLVPAEPAPVFRSSSSNKAATFSASTDGRRAVFQILDGVATVDLSVRPFRYDTLVLQTNSSNQPQISPDGEHVLLWERGPEDRVIVMRFDGSLPRILAQSQGGPRISRIRWAGPDRIVIIRDDQVSGNGTVVRFLTAEEHRLSTGLVRDMGVKDSVIGLGAQDFFPLDLVFNSDGSQSLWTNTSSDVTPETRTTRVTVADSNLRILRTFEVPHDIGLPKLSPDGRRAVFGTSARLAPCHPNCLFFLDLETGRQLLHTTPPVLGGLRPVAWTSRPLPPLP